MPPDRWPGVSVCQNDFQFTELANINLGFMIDSIYIFHDIPIVDGVYKPLRTAPGWIVGKL